MSSSFTALDEYIRKNGIHSNTPMARNGRQAFPEVLRITVYRGEPLPYFLAKNGARPQDLREFLLLNRIGRPSDLEPGTRVSLPKPPNTYIKPENI